MIDKEEILEGFDQMAKSKKQVSIYLKLCLIFAFLVVVSVLIWGYSVASNAFDRVVVLSKSGQYLETESVATQDLFVARIKSTCDALTQLANSFDRQTIKLNQAKAQFYCNKKDLNVIFQKYYKDRAYTDATNSGAVYRCTLDSVDEISGDNEPYLVRFTSTLNIYSSGKTYQFRILSEGRLVSTTPRYPENVTGFIFSELTQRVEQITDSSIGTASEYE